MSIDTTTGIVAGQLWRERRTGRVITIIDADGVYTGGGRVRYRDLQSGRRYSLLIHALRTRYERVEGTKGDD